MQKYLSNKIGFTIQEKEYANKNTKQTQDNKYKTISKDKILEMYLNNVYLGSGAYGIKGAAKIYFNKELKDLMSLNGIEITGLMNMAPLGADSRVLRDLFSDIKNYRDELENKYNIALPELSMGMSDDYEIAVQEGATIIRIGRKLFTV